MKSLMIIGAGFGQIPAILKAKEMGLKVIALDKNPNAIGMRYADTALNIDVIDFDGAINAAKKHNIDGVMTMQSDLPVPTVGAINDALNLCGISLHVANNCSNKIQTRFLFKDKKIPQPLFEVVETLEEANNAVKKIGYPCIFKAPDSSGSRGVVKVCSDFEIEKAFNESKKYTNKNLILVEEFIDGHEIGAQAFSINGKCIKVLLHNDIISRPPYMIPIGHSFPIELNNEEKIKAEKSVAEAIDALGISNGPSNVDLILDKNNNVKIIEVGARIGATCLPELVEHFTGIDWVKATIQISVGEETELKEVKQNAVAAFIIESPKDGVFKGVEIPEMFINKVEILEMEVTAKVGDFVSILRKGTDRIGKIIVSHENARKAEELAEYIKNNIVIHVQ